MPNFDPNVPEIIPEYQAHLFEMLGIGPSDQPSVPEGEQPLESGGGGGGSMSGAANDMPSEVVASAQDQQEPVDDGSDQDAEHDEFDSLFEEETSAAADASTVAGTPAADRDYQTPGTDFSDVNSNFK
ncbi:hypothetical protein DBV05_g6702 [Lasiodiplodia theobromae]|uniref:Uncharacterized protein n=1 Tax=Lasiodiplodia theobromae TaxID=45133 RepID=A0A5N5D9Z3_9PEZI|nr:hypothetical protein DBV05_g6702 [Lasiodiplodia theobromae]